MLNLSRLKNLSTIFATVAVMFVIVFTVASFASKAGAISKACQNSQECMEAVAKEQEANKNAASAAQSADFLQSRVNELNAEIARKELEIVSTKAEIEAINADIEAHEEKLLSEQKALAELLVEMHFAADTEPIVVLAGASSISDLAERQARGEVVKQQIAAVAQRVKEEKVELEANRAKVEALLSQQQNAKSGLEKTRAEQRNLVEKYQNDAAAYAAAASAAREAQRAAEKAEQEAHPELYRGSAYSGANTYPWQADCPAKQDYYTTYWEDAWGVHKIGGYVCECVSYVGWKAYEAYGIEAAWGNAYSWDDVARNLGYRVDRNPEAGAIGQADGYPYGHVFWVESVNGDGSINVTEYNNSYATYLYSGSSHFGDFGARTISAAQARTFNYIHFE